MKATLLLASLFVSLAVVTAHGQLPATGGVVHNLTLDVVNMGAGGALKSTGGGLPNPGANNNNNNTATATSTQTRNHTTTLRVNMRSLDKTPDEVTVEWYFFGKTVQNHRSGKEFVFDSGTKTVSIAPTGGATFDVTSKVAQTKRTTTTTANNNNNNNTAGNRNISYNTTENQSGTEISGWVVRMVVDGKVLDAKGSDFKYTDAAKDPDKFAALKAGKENP